MAGYMYVVDKIRLYLCMKTNLQITNAINYKYA